MKALKKYSNPVRNFALYSCVHGISNGVKAKRMMERIDKRLDKLEEQIMRSRHYRTA